MADRISPARMTAFRVLLRVESGAYASDALRGESRGLDSRDAGLAETIVFGCLRYQSQLDHLIGKPKLDAEVRVALRMGVFQLRHLERVPAHAAVSESVELVKLAKKRSAAGLVNALLRKVSKGPVAWPSRAVELNVPEWMLARWTERYGAEAAAGIARAALEEPHSEVNPETGRIQDIGAQSIVPLLDVQAGQLVLDLCAAPGNKTAQILARGARVVACDLHPSRLSSVPHEALRVAVDASRPLPFSKKFDRILVDAPCSGTGTLARNPEIKWRLDLNAVQRFPPLQRRILENALAVLKPGGVLVYSTCSLESEENEGVVAGLPVRSTHLRLPGRDPGDGFFAAVICP